jgi:hypothetical protein
VSIRSARVGETGGSVATPRVIEWFVARSTSKSVMEGFESPGTLDSVRRLRSSPLATVLARRAVA